MAETLKNPVPPNAAGNLSAPPGGPLAGQRAASEGRDVPESRRATPHPAAYGGNPSGRDPRKFRFAAGTPEGEEERRRADADRKKAARAVAQRLVEPPPLPAAIDGLARDLAAPSGPQSPLPGVADGGAGTVPWQPDMLREITDALIEVAESGRVSRFSERMKKGQLPAALQKEIVADLKFPAPAKKTAQITAPKVAAKWLNKSGLSGEYADELALAGSCVVIWRQGAALAAKLDELIRLHKAETSKAAAQPQPLTL